MLNGSAMSRVKRCLPNWEIAPTGFETFQQEGIPLLIERLAYLSVAINVERKREKRDKVSVLGTFSGPQLSAP